MATRAVTIMMAIPYQHHPSSQLSHTLLALCFGQAGPSVPTMIRVISNPQITRVSTIDQTIAFYHAPSEAQEIKNDRAMVSSFKGLICSDIYN